MRPWLSLRALLPLACFLGVISAEALGQGVPRLGIDGNNAVQHAHRAPPALPLALSGQQAPGTRVRTEEVFSVGLFAVGVGAFPQLFSGISRSPV